MDVTFEDYDPALHKDAILDFFADLKYKSKIIDWQFSHKELSSSASDSAPLAVSIVAIYQGKVVGFNGVMPVEVYEDGITKRAIWSCDLYISPSCRGKGVGTGLKKIMYQRFPRVLSSGVSDQAYSILMKQGCRSLATVTTYRKKLRVRNFRDLLIYCRQLFINSKFSSREVSGKYHIELSDQLPADEVLDKLWQRVKDSYNNKNLIVRDAHYLNWRYKNHPLSSYQYLVAHNDQGQIEGMMVIRINQQVSCLVDYVGPANNYALKCDLIGQFCTLLKGSRDVYAFSSDDEISSALMYHGFYKTRTMHKCLIKERGDVNSSKEWFIMAGDSDGELLESSRLNDT